MIIYIPIILLSTGFSPYMRVKGAPESQEYIISNSSGIYKLNLNVDVGDIEISYTYNPVDYHAKIEVITEMVGQYLNSNNFDDYFTVAWDDANTFTIELLSESWFDPSLWNTRDVKIVVTLNANILFDINITTNIEGDVGLYVPGGININNVYVNVNTINYSTKSNVLLDFDHCTIEGNITGIGTYADIELKTTNVQYTRNSICYLMNDEGELKFDIFQSKEMGANVTAIGVIKTNKSIISVVYSDYSSNIGAILALNNWEGYFLPIHSWVGFSYIGLDTNQEGYIFTSYDFPAKSNYNISLNRHTGGPWPYFWNLYSEPIEEN